MSHPHYSQRTAKILQIALLGSVSNALLVGLKLFIGVFGHSSAMIAEAINSLSDFVADLIALIFQVNLRIRITIMDMVSMRHSPLS